MTAVRRVSSAGVQSQSSPAPAKSASAPQRHAAGAKPPWSAASATTAAAETSAPRAAVIDTVRLGAVRRGDRRLHQAARRRPDQEILARDPRADEHRDVALVREVL